MTFDWNPGGRCITNCKRFTLFVFFDDACPRGSAEFRFAETLRFVLRESRRLRRTRSLPYLDLILELTEHQVATVQGLGWSGVTNGELLRRAAGRFDAVVTMDRKLEPQQRVRHLTLGIVVVRAKSNRMAHLRPLVPDILAALALVKPGDSARGTSK